MHPLFEFPQERQHWMCSKCRGSSLSISDSEKARTLEIYPLVRTHSNHITPLRAPPCTVLLDVPPEEFDWGNRAERGGAQPGRAANEARPKVLRTGKKSLWKYSSQESDAVWLTARPWGEVAVVE